MLPSRPARTYGTIGRPGGSQLSADAQVVAVAWAGSRALDTSWKAFRSDSPIVTCSDTAVAVKVVRLLEDDLAIVATEAGEEEVSVALVSAGVGDTILVHAREAIAVVPA